MHLLLRSDQLSPPLLPAQLQHMASFAKHPGCLLQVLSAQWSVGYAYRRHAWLRSSAVDISFAVSAQGVLVHAVQTAFKLLFHGLHLCKDQAPCNTSPLPYATGVAMSYCMQCMGSCMVFSICAWSTSSTLQCFTFASCNMHCCVALHHCCTASSFQLVCFCAIAGACCRELCSLHQYKPAACPFCRGIVKGFQSNDYKG